MKQYTVEEMQLEIDKISKEAEAAYQEALKLIYDKSTSYDIRFTNKFITLALTETDSEDELSPIDVLKAYKELVEDTKNDKDKALFQIGLYAESQDDDYATFCWKATFLDVVNDERRERIIKEMKRKKIGEFIKPDNAQHLLMVDCKAIEMFIDGELTYKGLVKSTYTDCEL